MNGNTHSLLAFAQSMLLLAAVLIAAGTLQSCTQAIHEDNPSSEVIIRTYDCSLSPATKTSLSSDGKVSWSADDQVVYYCKDGGRIQSHTISAAGETAMIPMALDSDATFATAVYGDVSILDHSKDAVVLEGIVKAEQNGTFTEGHVALARTTDINVTKLRFYNLVSYITFTTNRSDIGYVVFSSNDDSALHSNGSVSVSYDENVPVASLVTSTGTSIKVTLSGPGRYFIASLPTTLNNGFTITCYSSSGELIGTATANNPLTIKRSSLANLGLIDSHLVDKNGITLIDYDGDDNWDDDNNSNADIDLGPYGSDYNWDSEADSDGSINQDGYGNDSDWNSNGSGNGDVNQGGYGNDSNWDTNNSSSGGVDIEGYDNDSNWN